ncbi:MAG: 23S rRNA (adenine(2503)-C(2))-methyltransferase RlmN [Deltaproteobacteria bacterium]|nr:23S rRNA (adenine(2503)-C(2))-methyltransferase RlmN [Deltaproteobacteria bacterium]
MANLPVLQDLSAKNAAPDTVEVSDFVPPWETPAPERQGKESLWAQLPRDLARHEGEFNPERLFARIQRPHLWTNGLPTIGKRPRRVLAQFDMGLPTLVERHLSADGSTKCVLETYDGHRIEAVHMPRDVRSPRVTFCLSSQVGCAMGCTFCATGSMGIRRNLDAGEIIGQVLVLMHALGPHTGHHVNLVFMGMGEPLHNLENVHRALEVLCHVDGVGIAPGRITVSTSGLVSKIDALRQMAPRPRLAVSINATTDASRRQTMPVARKWSLKSLKASLQNWASETKEEVMLEYVLLKGENDTSDDVERLAEFANSMPHKINIIPLNEHESAHQHARPDDDVVRDFVKALVAKGCFVFVRRTRGLDVSGACGQLVQEGK